jgi:ribonuclease J
MTTEITAYGGVSEVGGNKFLVTSGDRSLFLDFGQSFGEEKKFFDFPFLRPRNEAVLRTLKMLPEMPGSFYKDSESDESSGVEGIVVSHAHLDHYGYTRYVSDEIPIVTGPATEKIILAREETGGGVSKDYRIANYSKRNGEEVYKQFMTARTGGRVDLEGFEVEPVHVDHSIPAAYGFIVTTGDSTIAYSGDLRAHGVVSEFTRDFAERAAAAEPDLLLVDCTHLPESKMSSEGRVEETVSGLVADTRNLVMAGFSVGDLDRLRSFYNAARKSGRVLAVSMKQAAILEAVRPDPRLDLIDASDPNVAIFMREKQRPPFWEQEILDRYPECCITSEDIAGDQESYVLVASLFDMNESVTITPEPESLYILSSADPFDEEGEISHSKLMAWLEVLGMPCVQIHASGHMTGPEVRGLVEEVGAKMTVPIHTDRPEVAAKYLEQVDTNIELLEKGDRVDLP